MAQRLKTDWILFFTIVAMVCFGLVIVYSASSVMAELKYKWAYVLHRPVRLGGPWCRSGSDVVQALDYRRFDNPVWAFAPLGM